MTYTTAYLADALKGELIGRGESHVSMLSAIEDIKPQSLVVCFDENALNLALSSSALCLVTKKFDLETDKTIIQVNSPQQAFMTLLHLFNHKQQRTPGISQAANIASSANISQHATIKPQAVISDNVVIKDNTIIDANCVIGENVQIGAHCHIHPNVTIHANTVIGSDGFGYERVDGRQQKIPHIGYVVIENNVEIGANSVIDKATVGTTCIGEGTKIDNLVQVAHNVKLGKHNILCAFTGIAGSSKSGDRVVFAADAGISDHVTIGDDVTIGPRTGIAAKKKLPSETVWLGNPGRLVNQAIEQITAVNRLPKMRKSLSDLIKRITRLEEKLDK